VAQAEQAVAPGQAEKPTASRDTGRWLLPVGVAALVVVLAVYAADLSDHVSSMGMMRDLLVYRDGGLIVRHISPPYHAGSYAPLYSWRGAHGVSFTYAPFAAVVFAVASMAPFIVLRWAMTLASLAGLGVSVWLTFGALGYSDRRVRTGATLLITAVALLTEPVQENLSVGQINILLMLLVCVDLLLPKRHWWNGIPIGVAAGIKLIPLIFIPYLVLTGKIRQAVTATATFVATIAIGYAVLPHDSGKYWRDGLFINADRITFLGTRGNQSLRGILTRFAGSVAAADHPWLIGAALVLILGLLSAAALYHAGHPVAGMLACALVGLLASPLSWDHHWVWVAVGLALLAHLAVQARGTARAGWWAAFAALLFVFGSWPQFWNKTQGLTPAGWVWYGPTNFFAYGDKPWYREYHWHGLQLIAGNSFILAGLIAMAAFVVAAVRLRQPSIRLLRQVLNVS
jgi:Glycosyltransferase family 87